MLGAFVKEKMIEGMMVKSRNDGEVKDFTSAS